MFERSLIERLTPTPQPLFDLGYSQPFWTPEKSEPNKKPEPAAAEAAAEDVPIVSPPTRDMRAVARKLFAPALQELEKFSPSPASVGRRIQAVQAKAQAKATKIP